MKVLVACEFSGVMRDAFLALGHDAISCDLEDTEVEGPHIRGDVRRFLRQPWDLVIAHPPCTYLCNSSVRWLHSRPERWGQMEEAAAFMRECLNANAPRVAVENPIMHKYAVELIGRQADQFVQPYHFGHPETKRTGLWLRGLPPLMPTEIVSDAHHAERRIHRLPPGRGRAKERSRTYPGIAAAMAWQWGGPS